MGMLLNPIRNFLRDMNYVYMVEIVVILSIIAFLLFVFNSLGLLKQQK